MATPQRQTTDTFHNITVDHITKRHKTANGEVCNDSNMEVPVAEIAPKTASPRVSPPHAVNCWANRSGVATLRQQQPADAQLAYYMGDDDEEKYPGIDELFNAQTLTEGTVPPTSPIMEISKEKYISLFKPWWGALIIKLLGKSVTYRVMQQRTTSLWNLDKGHELINLKGGYFVVRFFSRAS